MFVSPSPEAVNILASIQQRGIKVVDGIKGAGQLTFRWEDNSGLSRQVQVITSVLPSARGRQEGQNQGDDNVPMSRCDIAGFEGGGGGHQPKNVGSF